MDRLSQAFEYLDKGQHKRTNTGTLCVMIMGVVVIQFIPMVFKLLQARAAQRGLDFEVPAEFGLSTLVLLGSCWLSGRARRHKAADQPDRLRRALLAMVGLGVVFLALQYLGWQDIYGDRSGRQLKILLVIEATHGLYFLITLVLLGLVLVGVARLKTGADAYIYFLQPAKNLFFRFTLVFWNFLAFLWTALYGITLLKGVG